MGLVQASSVWVVTAQEAAALEVVVAERQAPREELAHSRPPRPSMKHHPRRQGQEATLVSWLPRHVKRGHAAPKPRTASSPAQHGLSLATEQQCSSRRPRDPGRACRQSSWLVALAWQPRARPQVDGSPPSRRLPPAAAPILPPRRLQPVEPGGRKRRTRARGSSVAPPAASSPPRPPAAPRVPTSALACRAAVRVRVGPRRSPPHPEPTVQAREAKLHDRPVPAHCDEPARPAARYRPARRAAAKARAQTSDRAPLSLASA